MARPKGSKNKPKDNGPHPSNHGKAKKAAKVPAAGRKVAKSHNQPNLEARRENFLVHRKAWVRLTDEQALLDKKWKNVKAAVKADGHTVKQMQIADLLQGNDKQNARVRGEVSDRLTVAYYIGDPMGQQLDLFSQPDRTPAVDRAYDEGKQDSMENKPCKPSYDASTPQYAKYMQGYGDHQETLMQGFKPPKDEDDVNPAWGDEDDMDPARSMN